MYTSPNNFILIFLQKPTLCAVRSMVSLVADTLTGHTVAMGAAALGAGSQVGDQASSQLNLNIGSRSAGRRD